jgi:hypothetical protein
MVLTAAVGTVAGGTMLSSFVNGGRAGPSFLLTMNPSTLSLEQGASLASTVSVVSVNGFSGTVSLSLFFTGSKLPALLNPTSVTVPANGTAKSTLSVTASSNPGTYNIVVIGLTTSHGKTNYASADLTVQVVSNQDFTDSLTFTAPVGYITVTGIQNPLTLSSGGTAISTLNIATSLSTKLGAYNITVTGTSGSRTHSTTISLAVIDPILPPPAIESLRLTSYQFVNSTTLSLILQNTGNTTVTLQSYTVRDASGNSWSLSSLAGPMIIPNGFGTAIILIGANCPGCVYGGIPGLFFQFNAGQSYTVTVTTTRNNQFSFTVTR